MSINPEIIKYSANEQMTFGDLKNSEFAKYPIDDSQLQKIQDIFAQYNIQ